MIPNDPKAVVNRLVRLLNAAFVFTQEQQGAVASVATGKSNQFFINLNGQKFEVTVRKLLIEIENNEHVSLSRIEITTYCDRCLERGSIYRLQGVSGFIDLCVGCLILFADQANADRRK